VNAPLLKLYKKGMMQRLFSQELRFTKPDGSPFPDWQEKRLGEVAKFLRGASLSKADLTSEGSNPAIHYGELFTQYSEIIKSIVSKTSRTDCTRSASGDILMPSSDVTPDGLGRASALFQADVMLGGDINIIRPTGSVVSEFLSYWIAQNKRVFIRLVTGTTVKHLYTSDLKSIVVSLPHPEEQQKIADTLTALDTKIDAVTAQMDIMLRFKKGLLQQMFV
jgi:restriction endonuclease S subunit